jgi:hypothetical protein
MKRHLHRWNFFLMTGGRCQTVATIFFTYSLTFSRSREIYGFIISVEGTPPD